MGLAHNSTAKRLSPEIFCDPIKGRGQQILHWYFYSHQIPDKCLWMVLILSLCYFLTDSGKGKCVMTNTHESAAGYWYSAPCDTYKPYICERLRYGFTTTAAPPPVPSSPPSNFGCASGWIGFGANCFQVQDSLIVLTLIQVWSRYFDNRGFAQWGIISYPLFYAPPLGFLFVWCCIGKTTRHTVVSY